jgi:transcriptional regulator GlxA family with amidase domain
VQPQATLAEFDALHAEGADYVVVAAMHPRDDERVLSWVREQSRKGAIIVGICSGVRTLAAAGLLEGRTATSYWYDAEDLAELSPSTRWVRDRRYVVDGNIVTTTGISASMPVSLAVVEAIAGTDVARAVAARLGVRDWSESHDGSAFGFDALTLGVALDSKLAFWAHDTIGISMGEGVDEISLAFAADAWSRTFRNDVLSVTDGGRPVSSRRGLTLLADADARSADVDMLVNPTHARPAQALDQTLAAIGRVHGEVTESFVATQLEYPR